jgi:hypothetical protein
VAPSTIALRLQVFRALASAAKRAGDIRLGLPALVVEDEQVPLSDASFDAITFIDSVKHILMETAVLRTIMPTLCSERVGSD